MGLAVVFPGQGTQRPGMGAPWRDHPAWVVVEKAEAALNEPVGRLLLDAPEEALARTREAQLAVLLTSLVAWEATAPLLPPPVAFAGHSLGQVTALVAAGVLSFDEGVRFAATRAELTQAAADRHPGRMAALLGATPEQAEEACRAAPGACWLANDNAPGQVVVAGTPEGLGAAMAKAKEIGIRRVMELNVGGAFHTPLMADARDDLVRELVSVLLSPPTAPVVSNGDAQAYDDAEGWLHRLADHVVSPVRWRPSMETLAGLGADVFVELGPGGMIAGLAKRTVSQVDVRGIGGPDDLGQAEELADDLGWGSRGEEPNHDGEALAVAERVIVSPVTGVFQPFPPETVTSEGEIVTEGQAVGTVERSGEHVHVQSRFRGFLMGMLAHPGERVREGQPVAWLRVL